MGKLSKIIEAIHAAGSGCAMDEFGSGYASLNLIQNIPPPARSFEYAFHQQVQHRHAQQYSPRRQTLLPALLGAGTRHRIQYNPLRGKRLEGPVRFQQVHSLVPDNRSQRHTFHPSRLRQFRIAGYGLRGLQLRKRLQHSGRCPMVGRLQQGPGQLRGAFPPRPQYVSNHDRHRRLEKKRSEPDLCRKGNHAVQPPVRHGRGFGAHGPKGGGTPSPAPPISSRSCLSSAPAPLATGTASIWCVISI